MADVAKALALVMLCACQPPVRPEPATAPVDIVEVEAGTFVAPSSGVFLSSEFFRDLLVGVDAEEADLKTRESVAVKVGEYNRKRADECSAKEQSWWQQNKFTVGLGIGGFVAALLLGGVVYGVSH